MSDELDLKTTYRAILDAARNERFISYSELAEANNVGWQRVRYKIPNHLYNLVKIAAALDWPIPSAIVVSKDNLDTGVFEESALRGFIGAATESGYEIGDPHTFIKNQQQAVFGWAHTAPDELILHKGDGIDALSANTVSEIFDDPDKRFWFVGAIWKRQEDQTERFYKEGIWQNGYHNKYTEQVTRIQPGDRIAIKSTYVRKYGLPFDNQKMPVSCMQIKAIGTVTEATKDGRTVKVDWQPLEKPREWYFYTYMVTIVEAKASNEHARRLIQFAFGDHKQDYEFWLRQPYWAKRYRARPPTQTEIEREEEEAKAELEEVEAVPYGVDDILKEGCFLSREALESILTHLENKRNLILQGPPGTGKTWLAKRLGYALVGTKDRAVIRKRMRSIQFHPSLSYEDFVRGWRPDADSNGQLSLIDGVFLEAVEVAHAEPDRDFVVIIEEINRGNPAQIFGEMLTLLEKDKRCEEEAIELAYRREQGERVFIPENLFVIGTMNIADRSLALVDLALRRRFAFFTLEAALDEKWRNWCIKQAGIEEAVLTEIGKRMTDLNDEIASDRTLGPQFKVGHSYVTPMPGEVISDARAWFRGVVQREIGPLLEEYWFDNPDNAAKSKAQLLQEL